MIRVNVNAGNLETTLSVLDGALSDLTPIWRKTQAVFLDYMKTRFQTIGNHGGSQWVPLSANYAAWKARHAPGKDILRLRDRLYGSLTTENAPETVFRPGPSFVEMGTSVPYAIYHQFGGSRLPARPVIGDFTKREGEAIVDIIQAYLFEKARRSL